MDPIIRANATDIICGSPFPNLRELTAISEEYGDLFGGPKNWLKLYKQATPKKYDFAYMKLNNPPEFYKNFEKVIGTGGMIKKDDEDSTGTVIDEQVEQEKQPLLLCFFWS